MRVICVSRKELILILILHTESDDDESGTESDDEPLVKPKSPKPPSVSTQKEQKMYHYDQCLYVRDEVIYVMI